MINFVILDSIKVSHQNIKSPVVSKPDEDIEISNALEAALSENLDDASNIFFAKQPEPFTLSQIEDMIRNQTLLYNCKDYSILDESYIHTCKGFKCQV